MSYFSVSVIPLSETKICPWISAGEGARSSRRGAVDRTPLCSGDDDRPEGIAGYDNVVGGAAPTDGVRILLGDVFDDQVARRAYLESTMVSLYRVTFNAVITAGNMDAGAIADSIIQTGVVHYDGVSAYANAVSEITGYVAADYG